MKGVAKTICSYCGVGCGIEAWTDRAGRVRIRGDEEYPVNRGMLCSKGMSLHHVANDRTDRLLFPEMRWNRNSPRERVSWDVAMTRAAAVFKSLIARHGPDSVAFYVSGQMLTEEYYIANKLVKGFLGTNNIDTNSRLCMSSAVVGYKLALGDDLVPASYEDIDQTDCMLIAGANPAFCHPILFRRMEARKAAHPQTRVIVVDPRRTQSCSVADLHLQLRPGTDVQLFHAIARVLIMRGLVDRDFVECHTNGFEELKTLVMSQTVEEYAQQCDVPAFAIETAALWIGSSPKMMSFWTMGLNQSAAGVEKNLALLNLSLLTGKIGKPGCGPFSLTGQPNAMGGREVGGLATMLAAHRDLANPAHREEVARYWGGGVISDRPGLTATELVDALERGSLKALWVVCTNPAVSLPNLPRFEAAIAKARFVVVQDISRRSETVGYGDLVLPAAGWLEKQGVMTNSERRMSHLSKVVEPPGEALPDVEIFCRFAKAMGFGDSFSYRDESEIFDEHARLTEGTTIDASGASHERLKLERSIQWPCPSADHPGTARLFADGQFATKDRRARLHTCETFTRSPEPTAERPFILTTGRVRDQWHTMTKTGKVARLRQQHETPYLEIHPDDASRLGVKEGRVIDVSSDHGTASLPARLSPDIKRGVVFLPMHWGKELLSGAGRANSVTSSRVDPRSKEPDLKYTTVSLSVAPVIKKRVVIVGAGAAALEFVRTYRQYNTEDELHVFGREPLMFYNRVLLIEYISGRRSWEELLTCDESTLEDLGVSTHFGRGVQKIDRKAKCIIDEHGVEHAYDKLVLATGSRPMILPGTPTHLRGVHSIRSRADADRLRAELKPSSRVLIVGGGLLGLEMAGELAPLGYDVTVIQNLPVLMGRQLDSTGAAMLKEILEERGVRVVLNDVIARYRGKDRIEGVRTRNGATIDCDVMICATGVRPNVELAQECGLRLGRGVVVDDHLVTSDPDVYAIGEIAEHRGQLYGTTPAANDEARVAAAHAAGLEWSFYKGSVLFNILKVHGLEVCSAGVSQAPRGDASYEEVTFLDRAKNLYKKCIVHRERLVGVILIGDRSEFSELRELIESGVELDALRDQLLRPATDSGRPAIKGPIVCSCHGVGRGNLEQFIADGCDDMESLCRASRAGTGCGSCRPEVKQLLDQLIPIIATA